MLVIYAVVATVIIFVNAMFMHAEKAMHKQMSTWRDEEFEQNCKLRSRLREEQTYIARLEGALIEARLPGGVEKSKPFPWAEDNTDDEEPE